MNICAECRYFKNEQTILKMQQGMQNEPRCEHPLASTRDPVMGQCFCTQERAARKGCGPTGKLWEKRA